MSPRVAGIHQIEVRRVRRGRVDPDLQWILLEPRDVAGQVFHLDDDFVTGVVVQIAGLVTMSIQWLDGHFPGTHLVESIVRQIGPDASLADQLGGARTGRVGHVDGEDANDRVVLGRSAEGRGGDVGHVVVVVPSTVAGVQHVRHGRSRPTGVDDKLQRLGQLGTSAYRRGLAIEDPHGPLDVVQPAAAIGDEGRFGKLARRERVPEQGGVRAGDQVGEADRVAVDEDLDGRARHIARGGLRGIEDIDRHPVLGEIKQVGLEDDLRLGPGGHVVELAETGVVEHVGLIFGGQIHVVDQRRGEVLDLQVVVVSVAVRVVKQINPQEILFLRNHGDDHLLVIVEGVRALDEVSQGVLDLNVDVPVRVLEEGVDDQLAGVLGRDLEEILVVPIVQQHVSERDLLLGAQHRRGFDGVVRLEGIDHHGQGIRLLAQVPGQVFQYRSDRIVDSIVERLDSHLPAAQPIVWYSICFVRAHDALAHQDTVGVDPDETVRFGRSGEGRLLDVGDVVGVGDATVAGGEQIGCARRQRRGGVDLDEQLLGLREIAGRVGRLDGQRVGPLGRDAEVGLVDGKVDATDAKQVARTPVGSVEGQVSHKRVDDDFPVLDDHRRVQLGRDAEVGDLCLRQDIRVADRHIVQIGATRVVRVDQVDRGTLWERGVDHNF